MTEDKTEDAQSLKRQLLATQMQLLQVQSQVLQLMHDKVAGELAALEAAQATAAPSQPAGGAERG